MDFGVSIVIFHSENGFDESLSIPNMALALCQSTLYRLQRLDPRKIFVARRLCAASIREAWNQIWRGGWLEIWYGKNIWAYLTYAAMIYLLNMMNFDEQLL